ncbi:WhiB family transcriptional regulator [Streptosporangium sp. NPDC051023]|uniref:WhiB family transcriptional regulator n=1 Tax=Streptosporangium sp. NPDC051023 TaxID=3155410 RepID=UPI00344DC46B
MALIEAITGDLSPELDGALCSADPELHTGPDSAPETPEERAARVQVAREVCAECPAQALCLARTLRLRPAFGVWAGLDAEEANWPSYPPAVLEHLADRLDDLGSIPGKQVA